MFQTATGPRMGGGSSGDLGRSPSDSSPRLAPLVEARGVLRDVLAAVRNLEDLLRSPRVGSRALAQIIPELKGLGTPLLVSVGADLVERARGRAPSGRRRRFRGGDVRADRVREASRRRSTGRSRRRSMPRADSRSRARWAKRAPSSTACGSCSICCSKRPRGPTPSSTSKRSSRSRFRGLRAPTRAPTW